MQPIDLQPKIAPLPSPGWHPPTMEEQKATLKQSVEDFVGILYAQMFQEMREAGHEDNDGGMFGGGDTGAFMGLFDQAIGKQFASSDTSGLKDILFKQLSSHLDATVKGGPQ